MFPISHSSNLYKTECSFTGHFTSKVLRNMQEAEMAHFFIEPWLYISHFQCLYSKC